MVARVTSLLAIAACGCSSDIPARPTWFEHVQPILRANCVRCHGADPYQGRQELRGFRLDRYVDDYNPATQLSESNDAYEYRQNIVQNAVDLEDPPMPPDYALSPRQQEILERWVAACPDPASGELPGINCAPKGTRANAVPHIERLAPSETTTFDQSIDLTYRAWDDDGDGLVVALGYRRKDGTQEEGLFVSDMGGGLRSVSVDTGPLASGGVFDIFAWVDDGYADLYDRVAGTFLGADRNRHEVVLLSDVIIDHGSRGTAPVVQLLTPNGGDTVLGEVAITWTASDADGDPLSVDLDLLRMTLDANGTVIGESVDRAIATGLPNDPSLFPPWSVDGIPATDGNGEPIRYEIRVTVSDGNNRRSDQSDEPFTIAVPTSGTALTWADVKPIFVTYCANECHGQPAKQPSLEPFRLDKYDAADPEPPANADDGVYEMRSQVYDRLVVVGSMPPKSSPQPSAGDIQKVADWILGGAPQSDGPVDGRPTFAWEVPLAELQTTVPTVTLRWRAEDPEAQPFQGASVAYSRVPSGTLPANASCLPSLPNWTAISEDPAVIADAPPPQTLEWTIPSEGCYCLVGSITDAAGQTTTAVAPAVVNFRASFAGPPKCP